MNLSRILLFSVLTLPGWLIADDPWQVLSRNSRVLELFKADASLYSISSNGDIRVTQNGVDWTLVTQLGMEGRVREFLTTSAGTSVWYRDLEGQSRDHVYKLFRTTNGETWEKVLDFHPDPKSNLTTLSEPIKTPQGWIMHTSLGAPAIVWFSPDGVFWEEKFRYDELAFDKSSWRVDETYAVHLSNHPSIRWLITSDGQNWTQAYHQPANIIELEDFSIGINNNPDVQGTVFYSPDNQSWETVFDPQSQSNAQRLIYGNGTFVLTQNYRNVYYSHDGRNWASASLPAQVNDLPSPLRITLGYFEGSFYYRLEPTAPPGSPVPGDPLTMSSQDGQNWNVTEFPSAFANEGILPKENPHFVNLAPKMSPSPQNQLPPAKEIEHNGFRLKMDEIPEGGRMGLFLAEGQEDYEIVNSTWHRRGDEYPYSQPVDIGYIGNVLLAVSESGYIAVLDPNANYLPQPEELKASRGEFDNKIELTWNPVMGADYYRVYRGTHASMDDRQPVAEVNSTTFSDRQNLDLNHRFYYQVQSFSDNGQISLPSLPVSGYLWSMRNFGTGTWTVWPEPDVNPTLHFDQGSPTAALHRVDSSNYPWIWSREHHWWYCAENPGNLWFYDYQLGWLWTRKSYYPLMYSWKQSEWLYFFSSNENVRWFYHYIQKDYSPLER